MHRIDVVLSSNFSLRNKKKFCWKFSAVRQSSAAPQPCLPARGQRCIVSALSARAALTFFLFSGCNGLSLGLSTEQRTLFSTANDFPKTCSAISVSVGCGLGLYVPEMWAGDECHRMHLDNAVGRWAKAEEWQREMEKRERMADSEHSNGGVTKTGFLSNS